MEENEVVQDSTVENTESVEAPEGQSAPEENLDYEKGVKLSEKVDKNPEALTKSQVADLEKLDKVRYNGKVYSGAEFAKLFKQRTDQGMTLEKYKEKEKAIAEERKYISALKYDLPKLKANPALIEEFKRVYPAQYHDYLELIEAKSAAAHNRGEQPAAAQSVEQKELGQEQRADWKQDPELKEMFETFQEQRLETARVQVNTMFDKLSAKYPDADDSWVAARVQAEREQLREQTPGQKLPALDESLVEKHFKESQAAFEKRATAWNAKRFQAQKSASDKAKGPGPGGGIPGGAPRQPRTIKEASALAMEDPNFN